MNNSSAIAMSLILLLICLTGGAVYYSERFTDITLEERKLDIDKFFQGVCGGLALFGFAGIVCAAASLSGNASPSANAVMMASAIVLGGSLIALAILRKR